jgi:hypothetical protein
MRRKLQQDRMNSSVTLLFLFFEGGGVLSFGNYLFLPVAD